MGLMFWIELLTITSVVIAIPVGVCYLIILRRRTEFYSQPCLDCEIALWLQSNGTEHTILAVTPIAIPTIKTTGKCECAHITEKGNQMNRVSKKTVVPQYSCGTDDITFCMNECDCVMCFRHPANIIQKQYPHSYAFFAGTGMCYKRQKGEQQGEQ